MNRTIYARGFLMMMLLPALLWLSGCSRLSQRAALDRQVGESVVLVGQQPARLAFEPAVEEPIAVRSTYRDGLAQTKHYERGRDYVLSAAGEIRRTETSRIPDYGTNILYGKEDFQHSQFPGYGNNGFFVFVDYSHKQRWEPPVVAPEFGARRLPSTARKLRNGERLRIVAFGDSITFGGEASEPSLIFWERWVDDLRHKYPRATIEITNGATGGDNTIDGLRRLDAKVLAHRPDLVLVAFGMNDHNISGVGTEAFAGNLGTMIDRIRATGAEVVLLSTFPPNPKWHFGSHRMEAYAEATERVAREKQCAYADVYRIWTKLSERKKPEDLLGNNINHPNDFGHWIYLEALKSIGL